MFISLCLDYFGVKFEWTTHQFACMSSIFARVNYNVLNMCSCIYSLLQLQLFNFNSVCVHDVYNISSVCVCVCVCVCVLCITLQLKGCFFTHLLQPRL